MASNVIRGFGDDRDYVLGVRPSDRIAFFSALFSGFSPSRATFVHQFQFIDFFDLQLFERKLNGTACVSRWTFVLPLLNDAFGYAENDFGILIWA